MSDDLKTRFDQAAAAAQKLPRRPDNSTLLKLYALYKQASTGDCTSKRPGFTDPVGQAKYDAWFKLRGVSNDKAMQDYIALVEKLK